MWGCLSSAPQRRQNCHSRVLSFLLGGGKTPTKNLLTTNVVSNTEMSKLIRVLLTSIKTLNFFIGITDRNAKHKCKSKSKQVSNRTAKKRRTKSEYPSCFTQYPSSILVLKFIATTVVENITSICTNMWFWGTWQTFICLVISVWMYKRKDSWILSVDNDPYPMCSERFGELYF